MARRLFTAGAFLSLVVCVAVGALWGRSYSQPDVFAKIGPVGYEVHSIRGRLFFTRYEGFTHSTGLQWKRDMSRHEDRPGHWRYSESASARLVFFGLVTIVEADVAYVPIVRPEAPLLRVKANEVGIPHWFLVVAAAPLPLAWAVREANRLRRRRRVRAGVCGRCGYDLRGTDASAACPECGTPRQAMVI